MTFILNNGKHATNMFIKREWKYPTMESILLICLSREKSIINDGKFEGDERKEENQ